MKILWKAKIVLNLLALEIVNAPEQSVFSPVDSRAALQTCKTTCHYPKTEWILAHCGKRSKRKVREDMHRRSHCIHNFSTSTRNVQVVKFCKERPEKTRVWSDQKTRCLILVQVDLRKKDEM